MKIKPSTVLKILGFVGIPVTAFFSAKAQVKAEKAIEEMKLQKGTPLETADVVKIEAKAHIWTIVSGVATIAAHAGAYSMDAKTIAGLVALVGTGGYAFKEHKEQLKKLIGTEKYNELEKKIKEAITLDHLKNDPPKLNAPVPEIGNGRKLYYDNLSQSWLTAEPDKVNEAIIDMEKTLNKTGVYYAKDWVRSLGITEPAVTPGDDDGWTEEYLYDEWAVDGTWIDVYFVDRVLDDGTPYEAIYIFQEPTNVEIYEEMGAVATTVTNGGKMHVENS